MFWSFKEFNSVRAWMMSGEFAEPSNGWPLYTDLYRTCIGCAISWPMMLIINKYSWGFFYRICKEKKDEEVRIAKTKKMVDNAYRAIYFTFASIWAFVLGRNTELLPTALGGTSDFNHMFSNYPSIDMPAGFKAFYLGTMGYHLHMMLFHSFFDHIRHDYFEMMFHHILALALFTTTYMLNFSRVGYVVLFMHDVSDASTQLLRCIVET